MYVLFEICVECWLKALANTLHTITIFFAILYCCNS